MLLYYHSWMFYSHFITTLYHFLGLTYWHSVKVSVVVFACFLLRGISVPNGVQSDETFWRFFLSRRRPVGQRSNQDGAQAAHKTPGAPSAPWWVVAASGTFSTASELYKYPNIPETLEVSTKKHPSTASSRTARSNLTPSRRGSSSSLVPLRWCVSSPP